MIKLGNKLHEIRVQKGISLDEVTKALKIRPFFLSAIERGEYHKLPASAYARGFIANYAEYLGVSKRDALALYRREVDEAKAFAVLPERFSETTDLVLPRLKIQYTTLVVLFAFFAFTGYIAYSYKDAVINPPLSLVSSNVSSKAGTVTIRGKSNPYAQVSINKAPVYVESDGTFVKSLSIFPGKTSITITAVNRFGKSTTLEKIVELKQ